MQLNKGQKKVLILLTKEARSTIKDIRLIPEMQVTIIKGIGVIYSSILGSMGITSVRALAYLEIQEDMRGLRVLLVKKWIITAKLLLQLALKEVSEQTRQQGKIIFAGLDQAGKTSLILSIKGSYFANQRDGKIAPTLGALPNRLTLFGIPIATWDYGGQKKLRESYLREPGLFMKLSLLFHVIDLNDYERFDLSLEYAFRILKVVYHLGDKPFIFFVCHKTDLLDDEEFRLRKHELQEKIVKLMVQLESHDWKVCFTTVTERKQILQVFAQGIKRISTINQALLATLEEVRIKFNASFVALYSENAFPIAVCERVGFIASPSIERDILLKLAEADDSNQSSWIHFSTESYQGIILKVNLLERNYVVILGQEIDFNLLHQLKDFEMELELWLSNFLLPL